jgi:membrane-associated protease RseP (regulator of RpoE activity)
MESTLHLPYSLWGFIAALSVVTVGHEAGHLLVAKLLGIPIRLISLGVGPTLWRRLLGEDLELVLRPLPISVSVGVIGRRESDGRPRRPVIHDMLMAAGGPAASVFTSLGLLMLAVPTGQPLGLRPWLIATAVLSVVVGLCSLVPLPGLDGGHLLVLSAARLGHELSPRHERFVHQLGLRLLTAACVVTVAAGVVTSG